MKHKKIYTIRGSTIINFCLILSGSEKIRLFLTDPDPYSKKKLKKKRNDKEEHFLSNSNSFFAQKHFRFNELAAAFFGGPKSKLPVNIFK